MPYAGPDHLATDYFEGSLEITEEQLQEGIEALISGRHVSIEGGVFSIYDAPPEIISEPTE